MSLPTKKTPRERLIEKMNPQGKRAMTARTQELTLFLHDLSEQKLPAGWRMSYAIADDGEREDGANNLDLFDREIKQHQRRQHQLLVDLDGDEDAQDNLAVVPTESENGGVHHVLIEMFHPESGAMYQKWIARARLEEIVDMKGPSRLKYAAMLADVLPGDDKLARRIERRFEKQRGQFLESRVSLEPLVDGSVEERKPT